MNQPKHGAYHQVTNEIKTVLNSNINLLMKWNKLTNIQRNEWICWITIPKQEKTRVEHLKRMQIDIMKGVKSPCCWPGCPHRNLNSAKWFDKKKVRRLTKPVKVSE